jgi:hypothetical protein
VLLDTVLDRGLLVASREILDELDTVLRRPKFARWLSPERREYFVRRIAVVARLACRRPFVSSVSPRPLTMGMLCHPKDAVVTNIDYRARQWCKVGRALPAERQCSHSIHSPCVLCQFSIDNSG